MNASTFLQKRVLQLVTNQPLNQSLKRNLETKNCEIFEGLEECEGFDVAFVDRFFINSGAVEFLKAKDPSLPLVVLSYGKEAGHLLESGHFYDEIAIPIFALNDVDLWILSWLDSAKGHLLLDPFTHEFGSGLWVDVILRMAI